jgi:hypothetical protein
MQILETGKTYNVRLDIRLNNGLLSTDMPTDMVNRVLRNALKDLDIVVQDIGTYKEEGEEPVVIS